MTAQPEATAAAGSTNLAYLESLPVHPLAAKFPLLAEDEVQDLATDISQHGLRQALVVAKATIDGELVDVLADGRNRLAACKLAGVDPDFVVFQGREDEITDLIISANALRRNLTRDQRIMAMAFGSPKPQRGKRSDLSDSPDKLTGHERNRLSQARAVLREAPEWADRVLAGNLELTFAFEAVRRSPPKQPTRTIMVKHGPGFTIETDPRALEGILRQAEQNRLIDRTGETEAERKERARATIRAIAERINSAKAAVVEVDQAKEADEEPNEVGEAIMEAVHRLDGRTLPVPAEFAIATQMISAARRFADECRAKQPDVVLRGLLPVERPEATAIMKAIHAWTADFIQQEGGS